MERKKLYFAHPLNTYDIPLEYKMLRLIKKSFPQFDIENPNQTRHQEGYKKGGMDYFYKIVINCFNVVAWPFLDGKVGAGVAGEMYTPMKHWGKWPLIIQTPRLKNIRQCSFDEISALIHWHEMKDVATNKEILEMVENEFVLSIDTTRKRTWEVLYEEYWPYEEAHLII